jgi:hypothetical protein
VPPPSASGRFRASGPGRLAPGAPSHRPMLGPARQQAQSNESPRQTRSGRGPQAGESARAKRRWCARSRRVRSRRRAINRPGSCYLSRPSICRPSERTRAPRCKGWRSSRLRRPGWTVDVAVGSLRPAISSARRTFRSSGMQLQLLRATPETLGGLARRRVLSYGATVCNNSSASDRTVAQNDSKSAPAGPLVPIGWAICEGIQFSSESADKQSRGICAAAPLFKRAGPATLSFAR